MFIFRTRSWRLLRAMREQIGWDCKRHKAIHRYVVTLSNGGFIATGFSRRLTIAWLRAHWNARMVVARAF